MPVRAQPLRVKFNEKPAVSLLSLSKKLAALRETAQSPRETFRWEKQNRQDDKNCSARQESEWCKRDLVSNYSRAAAASPFVVFHLGMLGVSYRLGGLLFPSQH